MERYETKSRGRPRSAADGATDAFDVIRHYIEQNNLSLNELALHCGLTPSSVTRALSSRDGARWTPTFKTIYSIALNRVLDLHISPVMKRLASYQGPGEIEVKRLLNDVEALITTLSASRRRL
jgi:transcriptional regulator with XRE-family HTH domain